MKLLGIKWIDISNIYIPEEGNIKKRMTMERVRVLAHSIEEVGLLHFPVVRGSDARLLSGFDRVAACIKAGKSRIQVQVAECEDSEIPRLEIIENFCRRHVSQDIHNAELKKLYTEAMNEEFDPSTGARGRLPSREGRAIAKTAEKLGIHRTTVQRRVEKMKEEGIIGEVPIIDFSIPTTDDYRAEILIVRKHIMAAQQSVKQAESSLTALKNASTRTPIYLIERCHEEAKKVATQIGQLLPHSICPWCKGMDPWQEHCTACHGTGWVNKAQYETAPEELLDAENLAICVDGKIELLEPAASEDIGNLF